MTSNFQMRLHQTQKFIPTFWHFCRDASKVLTSHFFYFFCFYLHFHILSSIDTKWVIQKETSAEHLRPKFMYCAERMKCRCHMICMIYNYDYSSILTIISSFNRNQTYKETKDLVTETSKSTDAVCVICKNPLQEIQKLYDPLPRSLRTRNIHKVYKHSTYCVKCECHTDGAVYICCSECYDSPDAHTECVEYTKATAKRSIRVKCKPMKFKLALEGWAHTSGDLKLRV